MFRAGQTRSILVLAIITFAFEATLFGLEQVTCARGGACSPLRILYLGLATLLAAACVGAVLMPRRASLWGVILTTALATLVIMTTVPFFQPNACGPAQAMRPGACMAIWPALPAIGMSAVILAVWIRPTLSATHAVALYLAACATVVGGLGTIASGPGLDQVRLLHLTAFAVGIGAFALIARSGSKPSMSR